jgi:putative membrane protein
MRIEWSSRSAGKFGPPVSQQWQMIAFLKRWIITTVAVLVAAHVVHGIHYDTNLGLLIATLILGLLNAIVRPVLLFLSLPLLILTFGLFLVVINALLLYWVGQMKTFHVDSFGAACLGSIIISLVSLILNTLTKSGSARVEIRRGGGRPPKDKGGPVIDV